MQNTNGNLNGGEGNLGVNINENSDVDLNCQNNNIDMQNLFNEIQKMCENYEIEIGLYKTLDYNVNQSNNLEDKVFSKRCNLCNELMKELEKKKLKIQELETEVIKLSEENKLLIDQYKNFDVHINSMLNDLNNKGVHENYSSTYSSNFNLDCFKDEELGLGGVLNTNINNLNKVHKETEIIIPPQQILIDIISDNILNDFKLEISTNIETMNQKLLQNGKNKNSNNFLIHLNTIFLHFNLSSSSALLSASPTHSYLQDIFIIIYKTFLKFRRPNREPSEYDWIIAEEEVTDEVISHVIEEIFSQWVWGGASDSNLESNKITSNGDRLNCIFSSTTKKKYIFDTKFDKKKFSLNKNILSLRDEIKDNFINKLNFFLDKIQNDLFTIITYCMRHIHAGKLVSRNLIIYDYWKLYYDINSIPLEIINNNSTLYYSQTIEAGNMIDNLIYNLKYKNKKIDSIYINGNLSLQNDKDDELLSIGNNNTNINFNDLNCNYKEHFSLKFPVEVLSTGIILYLNTNIHSLGINNTIIDEVSITFINKIIEFCTNLTTLDLSNNFIDDRGSRLLMDFLKLNKSITTLHLSHNKITSNGGFYIAEMLLKNNTIEKLFLSGNSINDCGLLSLVNILSNSNKNIKHLDLAGNHINSSKDIICISNLILKNLENLTCINLSNNKFDQESISTLGQSLQENTMLKILILNNIGLDHDSTPYLFQHLAETNLEEIYLDNNNLGEVGGVLFANVIKFNKKMKKFSLKKTNITSTSLSCICHALEMDVEKNNVLLFEIINLDENEFDDQSIDCLLKMLHFYSQRAGDRSRILKITISGGLISERAAGKICSDSENEVNKNVILL
jgi:Ran GTPase-activating protein (RanGAP) involved in mRNA processing and transport